MDDNKKFPDYFPEGCPPDDAKEMEIELYRFCNDPINGDDSDWKSWYEQGKKLKNNKNKFNYFGLSCNTDYNELKLYIENIPTIGNKIIVKGMIKENTGVVLKTSTDSQISHHTWWLYKKTKPHTFFEKVVD